ncbi:SDR family oxidoreductase [Gryllotalpicola protaetiae]|uniref:SDR family oxidoreductase n=1 Tax=Gryllotalpicola protaetiae TaxID=2419771 RepID=UPI0015E8B3BA|nr:LysR family transcriptional regulator [Gryllotalpicola protaetiae]
MRVVVLGGRGRIGADVVRLLQERGDDVVTVSRSTGVDAVQDIGLVSAFHGADTVVDVTNAAIYNEAEVVEYFTSVTRNVTTAEQKTGVGHHVALGIVGMDRLTTSGYLAGKAAQEHAIAESDIPSTIVRATQFFEFLPNILDALSADGTVRAPATAFQPVAALDVARAVADAVIAGPGSKVVEVAGPERTSMAEFLRRAADASRPVVEDADARYFGVDVGRDGLVPLGTFTTGRIDYAAWQRTQDGV